MVRWPPCARFIPSTIRRLKCGHVYGDVCLRAGVRLHVDVLGAEELLRAVNGKLLGLIHEFAAAVIALRAVAFGVLICQDRARRLQDRLGNEILRGDEFDAGGLAAELLAKDFSDFRIHVVETAADSY